MHLPGGAAVTDTQRSRYLGGRGVPLVTGPMRAFVVSATSMNQLGDGRESGGGGCGFGCGPLLDRGHDREVGGVSQVIVEHVFDCAGGI